MIILGLDIWKRGIFRLFLQIDQMVTDGALIVRNHASRLQKQGFEQKYLLGGELTSHFATKEEIYYFLLMVPWRNPMHDEVVSYSYVLLTFSWGIIQYDHNIFEMAWVPRWNCT